MKATIDTVSAPATLTKSKLKLGMVLNVVTKDVSMVGVVVQETAPGGNDLAFCPLIVKQLTKRPTSDVPLDNWPLNNLYFDESSSISLFAGTVSVSN
jgi:hypothetical protein